MPRTCRASALLAATAAAAAAIAVAALWGASAQAPTTRTLTFHEPDKGATFVHVRGDDSQRG
jgi:hypothetical protein